MYKIFQSSSKRQSKECVELREDRHAALYAQSNYCTTSSGSLCSIRRYSTGGNDARGTTACRPRTTGRESTRWRTSSHTPAGILVDDTTVLSPVCGSADIICGCRIHAERNPSEDTLRDVIAEQNILNDWIVTIRFAFEDRVFSVCGQLLGIAGIRLGSFDKADEVLVEEHLSNMCDSAARERVVAV